MYRPATRALAVLELLQTHRRISGVELAQRLGVDGRTVRRYIAALEELGIPITAERGRHGAYLLVAGFKLPPMMFTDDEALALSVGLLAARSMGLTEASAAVASAQAKLERVMPERLMARTRAVADTVMLDLARSAAAGTSDTLFALSAAAQQCRRVHMGYRAANGVDSERGIDPYGLAHTGGFWYVVGHCHLRRGLRSFRLDRITEVVTQETLFVRPRDFDAVAHLTFSLATLPREHTVEVLLHTTLDDALERLGGTMGLFEPTEAGVLLRAQVDGLDWFARQLARQPFDFTVRGPEGLRTAVGALAARLGESAARGG
ncbi:YafY family transcriptional regulator [Dyella sp. LX-66]|uniref:helix-turn-helix transcriptional regulator n=1 Tax=unclassified Dyella TaxID=2634549 RepID=UPI001BE0DB58|nr:MULTISPECIES: YafY family protein [unclassified Dyella]MBT2117655.1 YafY family transcriptional regulator [Dyella sp. LX-1]MBT2141341.1 YafY family transcriptional regulator [Dyella sp. LX-66]